MPIFDLSIMARMMKSFNTGLLLIGNILLLLGGCQEKSRDNQTPGIAPLVKYEFSKGAGHYNYAPSVIQDTYGIRYGFICENRDPFQIVDYVYLYKGIPTANGYVWQPGTPILAPSETGWDNCHICDPDVREFTTIYKGETYHWIMTYLGVDQWDSKHNQIGLAISKNIEGPYIKFEANPLVPYEDRTRWGVGQSTTIVKDSTSILLFYTSITDKGVGLNMREIKLNDLDNIVLGEEKKVPFIGPNSYPAMSEKHIYMASEIRVGALEEIPNWVGDVSRLSYMPRTEDIFSEENRWTEIGHVGPEESGFPRNHNPAILTDTKGYMLNEDELVMYFTPAMTGENWLWSYDLYSASFNLKNYFK